jgi:hypothetical protein
VLVGFAAVLTVTSVVSGLTGVSAMPAELPPVPAAVSTASVTSATSVTTAPGAPVAAALADAPAGSTPAQAPAVIGTALGRIAALDSGDVRSYVSTHPADLARLLADPPAAGDVGRVWNLLGTEKQSVLLREAPHIVGNLEGVPYAVRGAANALDLKQTIAGARSSLRSEHGKAARLALQRKLTTLGNVEKALGTKDGVHRTLVSLDTSADARAAIVVGDLATAKYVSVLVPGMYMSVGEQIEAWAEVAQDLHDQQTDFLHRFLGPRGKQGGPGVAVVAWIGYQTPVLTNIGGMQLAQEGADSLERTLAGIETLRADDPPYLSVLAHSYGSTAALLALERGTVTVDALALMGSPGSDAQSVAGLSVRDGNVYVAEAPMDPIVNSAFFGSDPGSPAYGAKHMSVDGAVDPITHRSLAGSSGHNEYFTAGTESMRNLALIGIDKGGLVL